MTRFIHSADWQLGMTRHFLAPEAQARFDGARNDAVRRLGEHAVSHACEFVVVAGDVFESNHVDRQVIVRALDAMAATPGVRFYLLPGNHDPLDASSVFRSRVFTTNQPDNVVVIETAEPMTVAPSVQLVGAPWYSKRPLCDLVADSCSGLVADGVVRVVVGHGAVDALSPDAPNPALISLGSLESQVAAGAVHYVALGDRHSTTAVGTTGRVHYSGAPEPTDFREIDPGNALLVDLGPGHCHIERLETGTWTFVAEQFDVNGAADLEALDAWVSAIERPDRCNLKLGMVGQVTVSDKARLDSLLDNYRSLFASIQIWDRRSDLAVLPSEEDFGDLEFTGFAAAALEELRARSTAKDDLATEALGLLYRLGMDRA